MANYYPIPLEEMDEVLRGYRFAPVDLTYRNRPVKEWVYERRLPQSPNHFVRVYTGVQRYGRYAGRSRKVGKDAIRVQVVYRDEKGETLVSQPKRVHRVDGWRENLQKRMNEISSTLPQVEFDTRGEPMTLRKYQGNYFWGSRDYPKYKETKRFASEETVDAESFSAAEDIMNYLDTIWNEHSREIKEYVKNQMAGGGMNRDFDNDSMLNYTEDEWFDYKWELFRKSFEEGAWLTDGYVQAIRLLYVPVGTQIRLDELGNWKNRKADKYGVDGKEITSWIWETIKLQEFYGGGIFGDGDIDHTEGEEGIDFDRIVLNGFFKITDIDWLSTIAFNISSWNQEKELCVINGKPIIDGEIMRNDGSGKYITGFSADEWDIRKVAQYRAESSSAGLPKSDSSISDTTPKVDDEELDEYFDWIVTEMPESSEQTGKDYSRKVDYLAQRYSDYELKNAAVNAFMGGDMDAALLFKTALHRQGFIKVYQQEGFMADGEGGGEQPQRYLNFCKFPQFKGQKNPKTGEDFCPVIVYEVIAGDYKYGDPPEKDPRKCPGCGKPGIMAGWMGKDKFGRPKVEGVILPPNMFKYKGPR